MSTKIKQTTRKFYNKWTYKISIKKRGVTALRYKTFEDAIDDEDDKDLKKVFKTLSSLDSSQYCKRIEVDVLDIYTNDKSIFDNIYNNHNKLVKGAFAPNDSLDDLLSEKNVILAKKLPHDRYRYKVFLQPHRITSLEEKTSFINWLGTQEPRVNISTTVKEWFYKTRWNWDRRYMYVEDDQTLLLIKLKNSQALGTIYTFRISDK
jgi:hypothetical protein